jgi:predicted lipid-binding transport protein (Tim44 family)
MRLAGFFAALLMVFSMVAVGQAEARMGGSFGSRGTRTFQSVPSTVTSPRMTSPVQRSMTPNNGPSTAAPASQFGNPRPSFFGGFGGSLLGGLLFGGMLGMMFGHGFGGIAGGFGFLFQLLIIGGVLWLIFRSRAPAAPGVASSGRSFGFPGFGGGGQGYNNQPSPRANKDEIGISNADLETFERILHDMQDAFAREDYAGLRQLTTPEMVSYLSEELSQNATQGVKNEVSNLKFLQGDVAESWREGNRDYATVAMRYSANDVLRDRATGKIVKGDAETPTETTELWTFTREGGRDWQLSAIQEA